MRQASATSTASGRGKIASPKRSRGQGAEWYPYYAGFSPAFVRAVLAELGMPVGATIADPWNGSGTTTACASELKYEAIGVDINPAMALIAAGRMALKDDLRACCTTMEDLQPVAEIPRGDPLLFWFEGDAANVIRGIEHHISSHLTDGLLPSRSTLVSPSEGLHFTALFLTVRALMATFAGSNPTWIRRPDANESKIHATFEHIVCMYARNSTLLREHLATNRESAAVRLMIGDSRSLALDDATVDAVITSPPYCTRLDYPIATRAELAVLGIGPTCVEHRQLRQASLGTTTVAKHTPGILHEWGQKCATLLEGIRSHESKASQSYYFKTHCQYFDSLNRSLRELNRVLRPGGKCVVVVQDSRYKELHTDLPGITSEMGEHLGWKLEHRMNFPVRSTLADSNPVSKRYRSRSDATESVLWFARGTSSKEWTTARRI
ncbi:MAG: DNA methyltransferase [Candidatus Binatia bacterium]